MPSPERFSPLQPREVPPTDYGELIAQPTTSLRMQQAVTHLAAAYRVDIAQAGASFAVDMAQCPQCWLIANIDGERIGVTRCQVDEENQLSPDLDMVFDMTPTGWRPVEIVHALSVWESYVEAAHPPVTDAQGNFDFVNFANYMAEELGREILFPIQK